eukprot:6468951-Amphidinium_carterae.2
MESMLHMTSTEFELEELNSQKETGSRCYPVLHMRRGRDLQDMLRTGMSELKNFGTFLTHTPTEAERSRWFRVFMRPMAAAVELIRKKTRGYPFQLFGLIDPEEDTKAIARKFLHSPPCLDDSFSRAIRERFIDEAALCSEPLRQLLHAVASLLHCSTTQAECAHSGNQRRAFSRVQTHTMSLSEAALASMAYAGPLWAKPPTRSPNKARGRPPKQPKRELREDDDVGGQGAVRKRRKKHSGGGAWNEFLAVQLGARSFSAQSIHHLQAQYHSLSDTERSVYQCMAKHRAMLSLANHVFFKARKQDEHRRSELAPKICRPISESGNPKSGFTGVSADQRLILIMSCNLQPSLLLWQPCWLFPCNIAGAALKDAGQDLVTRRRGGSRLYAVELPGLALAPQTGTTTTLRHQELCQAFLATKRAAEDRKAELASTMLSESVRLAETSLAGSHALTELASWCGVPSVCPTCVASMVAPRVVARADAHRTACLASKWENAHDAVTSASLDIHGLKGIRSERQHPCFLAGVCSCKASHRVHVQMWLKFRRFLQTHFAEDNSPLLGGEIVLVVTRINPERAQDVQFRLHVQAL